MNPWHLIGWGIVAFVAVSIGARILRSVVAGVRAGRKMVADIRRSLASTPEVGQRWRWFGESRRVRAIQPDGSVEIEGTTWPPPILSPERWQAEIRAGRLVAP